MCLNIYNIALYAEYVSRLVSMAGIYGIRRLEIVYYEQSIILHEMQDFKCCIRAMAFLCGNMYTKT